MRTNKWLLYAVFIVLLYLIAELLLRVSLCLLGYPFLYPAEYLEKKFYPYIILLEENIIHPEKDVRTILILGGSVVNSDWTRMEFRLDTLLRAGYPKIKKFRFFNVAMPGHTSLDNLIKYQLLRKQHYDLVIFYEAINENRANNIQKEFFKNDYSHIKWYDDIRLIRQHPEMNITILPYVVHLTANIVSNKIMHRNYISHDDVDPDYSKYGADIKTAVPYLENVNSIANLAKEKGDKLLLVKYSSYFPSNVKLTGKSTDKQFFSKCYVVSPVTTWGRPENVEKGIMKHNEMLGKIATSQKTYFFDMAKTLPQDSTMFCDVCHLSEKGAQYFSKELSEYIITQRLLN